VRALITGTRDDRYPRMWLTGDLMVLYYHCWNRGEKLTLVHGDYPTGVDSYVRLFAEGSGGRVEHEPHPADWRQGKYAGPHRNQHMVDLGADLCLAYPWGESRGTRGCARFASRAGIPTLVTEHDLTVSQTLEHRLRQAGIMILEETR
jgi:hypothetical protein